MRTIKIISLGIAGLAGLFTAIGFLLPSTVVVERSTVIQAPASTVYTLVNSFVHFNAWSPWAKRDPATEYRYSGPRSGVGAAMEWHSTNPDVGSGRQEIIESVAYEQVVNRLEFGEMGALASFWLKPADGGVALTWRFETDLGDDLLARWFGLLFDSMIGADYEQGLAALKALAESYPPMDIADLDVAEIDITARPLLLTSRTTTMDEAAMLAAMNDAYGSLRAFLESSGVAVPAEALAITREWNEAEGSWSFDAAYPLPADATLDVTEGLRIETGWQGRALRATLVGADYATSAMTYEKIDLYMRLHGLEAAGASWEAYRSDPLTTPHEELVTEIFFPLR